MIRLISYVLLVYALGFSVGGANAQFRPPSAPPSVPPYVPPRLPPYVPPYVPPHEPPYVPPHVPPYVPPYVPPNEEGSRSGGGNYPHPAYVLPAVCLTVDVELVHGICDVVSAAKFARDLQKALEDADKFRAVTSLMLEAGRSTLVGLIFPAHAHLAEKIDVVEAIRDSQVALFRAMEERIRTEFVDNPNSAIARRVEAITSAERYTEIVHEAVSEARESSDETVTNLQSEPDTSGVRSRCFSACEQAIQIYRTGAGFD